VIDRPEDVEASVTDAVAHAEEIVEGLDVEGDVLHGSAGIAISRTVRHLRTLDERDRGEVVELYEAVERALDAVHPVQSFQLPAEHVGEELELVTHSGRRDREMMHAIWIVHISLRFSWDRVLAPSRPGTLARPRW